MSAPSVDYSTEHQIENLHSQLWMLPDCKAFSCWVQQIMHHFLVNLR